jgi:glycerol uptake facilitator-like aquaporin
VNLLIIISAATAIVALFFHIAAIIECTRIQKTEIADIAYGRSQAPRLWAKFYTKFVAGLYLSFATFGLVWVSRVLDGFGGDVAVTIIGLTALIFMISAVCVGIARGNQARSVVSV